MTHIDRAPEAGMNAAMAATLRAERAVAQLTIDALAERSGIPKRTLIRLLNAERSLNIEHIAALAGALQLPVATLIERAQDRIGPRSLT